MIILWHDTNYDKPIDVTIVEIGQIALKITLNPLEKTFVFYLVGIYILIILHLLIIYVYRVSLITYYLKSCIT